MISSMAIKNNWICKHLGDSDERYHKDIVKREKSPYDSTFSTHLRLASAALEDNKKQRGDDEDPQRQGRVSQHLGTTGFIVAPCCCVKLREVGVSFLS